MKSYTDISQSKKLAEILPLESADMFWQSNLDSSVRQYLRDIGEEEEYFNIEMNFEHRSIGDYDIPAWSLTALFGVMPQITEWNTPYGYKNDKLSQFEPKICKIWEHSIIPSFKVTYGNGLSTDIYDNPVDACVAMIEKLNELKML